jgi:2-dehydro-3-deoxyphosphogluconate aldolase/(4S)-4-hydroxy-2-oxoglutarate aldolase
MSQLSPQHRERIQSVLAACPLIPVISINEPEKVLPLGRALVEGGIKILEVTLRTEHGLNAISQLRQEFPHILVGVGTVVTIDQYRDAEAAGAQFVISPGATPELLDHGINAKTPLLPGIATVSELMAGYIRGYRAFKFFPAEVVGGVPALKAFEGPFPDVIFCPTGGIRRDIAKDYLSLPNVAAVGGTWLTPEDRLIAGDWPAITELARGSLKELEWM